MPARRRRRPHPARRERRVAGTASVLCGVGMATGIGVAAQAEEATTVRTEPPSTAPITAARARTGASGSSTLAPFSLSGAPVSTEPPVTTEPEPEPPPSTTVGRFVPPPATDEPPPEEPPVEEPPPPETTLAPPTTVPPTTAPTTTVSPTTTETSTTTTTISDGS